MTNDWAPGERRRAGVLAAVVLGATLYPLRQYLRPAGERVDGFPLSYYPMFSARRRQHAKILYVVGVRADGSRRYVHYHSLGPGGLNQVRRQLKRVVTGERVEQFADDLAQRLAADLAAVDLVRVEVVRGEFDLDACMLDRHIEGTETVLAGADLPGRTSFEVAVDRVDLSGLPA